jgi:hypothetical protein
MTDLKRIEKIQKHIGNLDDSNFLDGIRRELDEILYERKNHLEFIKDKEICPVCRGKCGYLESYNDGIGQRDVDWCKCDKCKGTGYIDKI